APGYTEAARARANLQFDHSSRAQSGCLPPMKLHADTPHQYAITAHGEGWININGERHSASVVLSASAGLRGWACTRFEDLQASHFSDLLDDPAAPPELVL